MARIAALLSAIPVVAGLAMAPSVAHADWYRGGYGGYRGGYGHGYYRGGGFAGPAIVGGALLGLGLGAALAPRYYAPPPVYYAPPPPPVYYAPPPVYYAPPPAYYPAYR